MRMAHLGFPGGPSFFMPVFVQTGRSPPEGTERKGLSDWRTIHDKRANSEYHPPAAGRERISDHRGRNRSAGQLSQELVQAASRGQHRSFSVPAMRSTAASGARQTCTTVLFGCVQACMVEGAPGAEVASSFLSACLPVLRYRVQQQSRDGQLLQPGMFCQSQSAGGVEWIRRYTRR